MTVPGIATSDEAGWCGERYEALVANVSSFIRGNEGVVRLAAVCLVAQGHLLIEDAPGTGKTSLAKSLASSIDEASFRRIQFTPDLLPSDVTGSNIFDMKEMAFRFFPGAVFAHIVLADEINRASPKTQAALLEVMEERQVTIDGHRKVVPSPFLVMATQNPIEMGGTYVLPEAQLDRFMMRVSLGYPSAAAEAEIVDERTQGRKTPELLPPVLTLTELSKMIDISTRVYIAPQIMSYIVAIVAATRKSEDLRLGASPRASVLLARLCQANAATSGKNFVTADDVKALAARTLAHRCIVRPEAEIQNITAESVVEAAVGSIPVPTDTRRHAAV